MEGGRGRGRGREGSKVGVRVKIFPFIIPLSFLSTHCSDT